MRWRVLAWLVDGLEDFPTRLHAYSLLPSSVLLLLTPGEPEGLSGLMQMLARRTSLALAASSDKVPIWAGRFRSAVLQPEPWALPATVWVDSAAQRAGLAAAAQAWPWSSQAAHCGQGGAGGSAPALHLLQPHWALGNTPFEREAGYSRLLQAGVSAAQAQALERALRGGLALGDVAFLRELEEVTGRRVRPAARGRPRKEPE